MFKMTKDVAFKTEVYILVTDLEDLDILNKSWWINAEYRGSEISGVYVRAKRNLTKTEKATRGKSKIYLHQEIWEKHNGPIPEGFEIDHINFNALDNRKSNLRLLSKDDNRRRRGPRKGKTKATGAAHVSL